MITTTPTNPKTTITTIADKKNHEGIRMWPSSETAAWAYNIANIGLIIGLVFTFASTILVVWMGNIKEEYLKRDLAKAGQLAAESNRLAAEANRKAEEERLARVKIEEKLAPRSLSQAQQESLRSNLTHFAGTAINVRSYPGGTPDTLILSSQIVSALIAAKWKVATSQVLSSNLYVRGIVVAINNRDALNAATQLVGGLISEGIAANISDSVPSLDGVTSGSAFNPNEVALTMFIGTKP